MIMKKYLMVLLSLGLFYPYAECGRLKRAFARISAALGLSRSRIPDKFRPSETWLHPNTLFHGSPCMDIEIIQPKQLDNRCNGRPIVFASHHIGLASLFMLKHRGKFACGRLPNERLFYMTDDKKGCILNDKGGAIYVVPSASFFCEAHVSLGTDEWLSYSSIEPLYKFVFPSALDAILDFGVRVYFVDASTYARYWRLGSSDKEWLSFFKHLQPLTKEQLALERAFFGIKKS